MSTVADNLLQSADIDRLLGEQSARPINAGKVVKHIFTVKTGFFATTTIVTKSKLYADESVEVVWIKEVQSQDLQARFAKLKEFADKHSNTVFFVDATGCGRMAYELMKQAGIKDAQEVMFGSTCFKKQNRTEYFNKRAMCHVKLARSVARQKIGLLKVKPSQKQKLKDQLSAMRAVFDDQSRFKVPNNQDLVWVGIKSMDFVDALAMAFYDEGAT